MENNLSTKDVLARIEKHEAECTIRWKNVEEALKKGSSKMQRLETRIYGFNTILLAGILAILSQIA